MYPLDMFYTHDMDLGSAMIGGLGMGYGYGYGGMGMMNPYMLNTLGNSYLNAPAIVSQPQADVFVSHHKKDNTAEVLLAGAAVAGVGALLIGALLKKPSQAAQKVRTIFTKGAPEVHVPAHTPSPASASHSPSTSSASSASPVSSAPVATTRTPAPAAAPAPAPAPAIRPAASPAASTTSVVGKPPAPAKPAAAPAPAKPAASAPATPAAVPVAPTSKVSEVITDGSIKPFKGRVLGKYILDCERFDGKLHAYPANEILNTIIANNPFFQKYNAKGGWKIHLNVAEDLNDKLTRDVAEHLLKREDVDFKIGHGGCQQDGKGMVVYCGSWDKLNEVAKDIHQKFGDRIPQITNPKAAVMLDDIPIVGNVRARFEVSDLKANQHLVEDPISKKPIEERIFEQGGGRGIGALRQDLLPIVKHKVGDIMPDGKKLTQDVLDSMKIKATENASERASQMFGEDFHGSLGADKMKQLLGDSHRQYQAEHAVVKTPASAAKPVTPAKVTSTVATELDELNVAAKNYLDSRKAGMKKSYGDRMGCKDLNDPAFNVKFEEYWELHKNELVKDENLFIDFLTNTNKDKIQYSKSSKKYNDYSKEHLDYVRDYAKQKGYELVRTESGEIVQYDLVKIQTPVSAAKPVTPAPAPAAAVKPVAKKLSDIDQLGREVLEAEYFEHFWPDGKVIYPSAANYEEIFAQTFSQRLQALNDSIDKRLSEMPDGRVFGALTNRKEIRYMQARAQALGYKIVSIGSDEERAAHQLLKGKNPNPLIR